MPTIPTEAEGSTTVSEQAVLDVVRRWADVELRGDADGYGDLNNEEFKVQDRGGLDPGADLELGEDVGDHLGLAGDRPRGWRRFRDDERARR
jgi:hypothetical protein